MAKFCGKCGAQLDMDTGLCPKCETKQIKKAKKTFKKEQKRLKKSEMTIGKRIRRFFLKLIIMILFASVLALGAAGALVYFNVMDIPFVDYILTTVGIERDSQEYELTPPDVDEYFEENSDVISIISTKDSVETMTEADTCKQLVERGFEQYPITTEYSMDGEYQKATDISDTSLQKHPIYQTYYVTSSEEIWTITVVNGIVMATPVSYNMQSEREARLIISETDTIISYDSTTNQFYETIPKESVLIVKKVSRIDHETLENLTIEAIDEL